MKPELLTPTHWKDYQLIDSGAGRKLERFGPWITSRPEPQAIWNPSLSEAEWERMAHATFKNRASDDRGEWTCKKGMRPDQQWFVEYRYGVMALRLRLALTAFKHVGVFPEQAANWDFLWDKVNALQDAGEQKIRVLNLFAYTGGATLAARAAGAEVTHVDAIRQVVAWGKENMEATGLHDIRWIVDDAMKFVKREVKRGKQYHGIILDPPAYGRGPDGERWVLDENINELLAECAKLIPQHKSFLVLNLYSMGLSALLAKTAVNQIFGPAPFEQFGELYVSDQHRKNLPLGVCSRFFKA
ncbi:MAG: class I SAM-dependent methyltransferase [Rikenellaceae bacterium]|jgi:23S rRNA (cytosine1962-C5)-methyltransferase|nr:class I SAM-dependent methyltransferase [Rikenellaceae bacterium]